MKGARNQLSQNGKQHKKKDMMKQKSARFSYVSPLRNSTYGLHCKWSNYFLKILMTSNKLAHRKNLTS
jgi:hypothetical protein